MHSSSYNTVGDGNITVHHNGDFSGDVLVQLPPTTIDNVPRVEFVDMSAQRERMIRLLHTPEDLQPDYYSIWIPFDLMKQIVADAIQMELISRLEQMTSDEILNFAQSRDVLTMSWLDRQDRDS